MIHARFYTLAFCTWIVKVFCKYVAMSVYFLGSTFIFEVFYTHWFLRFFKLFFFIGSCVHFYFIVDAFVYNCKFSSLLYIDASLPGQ